jgi:hypothetical protein
MPRFTGLSRFILAASLLAATVSAPAQVPAPDATVGAALRSLASHSGTAYLGQVTHIERTGGVVEIVFRVDQPLLGAPGSTYTLREWAGLWPPGQHRYVAGQRVLIFLHTATGSSLTSPVDGMEGVVPVIPQGTHAAPLLDVRRLDARLQRDRNQPLPSLASSAIAIPDATSLITNWRHATWREPVRHALPGPPPALPASLAIHRLDARIALPTQPGFPNAVR